MYQWEYQESPGEKESLSLLEGIRSEAILKKSMTKAIESFGFFIKSSEGKVLGGIQGVTYYGALYIDMLWISEELRHQGMGTKLMLEAEALGIQRQCSFSIVNTMDWEALSFYQGLGYEIELTRCGYEKHSKMYCLRKELA